MQVLHRVHVLVMILLIETVKVVHLVHVELQASVHHVPHVKRLVVLVRSSTKALLPRTSMTSNPASLLSVLAT